MNYITERIDDLYKNRCEQYIIGDLLEFSVNPERNIIEFGDYRNSTVDKYTDLFLHEFQTGSPSEYELLINNIYKGYDVLNITKCHIRFLLHDFINIYFNSIVHSNETQFYHSQDNYKVTKNSNNLDNY